MKFVIFTYDTTMPTLHRLLDDGHELCGLFTFQCDNIFNFNREVIALAQHLKAPVITSPAEDFHIQKFIDEGVECFISAGYPYKIPTIDEKDAYAVNIHPAILPNARGFMPIPHIIMNDLKDAAGISAHKMTDTFDAGDLLMTQKIKLSDAETVESYGAKLSIIGPDFTSKLLKGLPQLWQSAKPQNTKKAQWIKAPNDQTRTIDWNESVKNIDKIGRAFGRFGVLTPVALNGKPETLVTYHYDAWLEKHDFTPGTILSAQTKSIVVAVKDGFICLKDFQKAA